MKLPGAVLALPATAPISPLRQAACAFLAVALLGGCATGLQSPSAGESVAVSVTTSAGATSPIKIRNEAVGSKSTEGLVGGGAGAVAGGVWGLACGPLAALCVPLAAMLGAEVGAGAGLLVGTTAALSDEKSALLRDRVTRVLQSHDVCGALQADVIGRAQIHWDLKSAQPAWVVEVELVELSLASTRDERVRWVVKVLVDARPAGADPAPPGKRRAYAYDGPYGSLSNWMDEGNDFVYASLARVSAEIATKIVSDLAVKTQAGPAQR